MPTHEKHKQPKATRPKMESYGVPLSDEGILPWTWAQERLTDSHNYLITTVRDNGAPHVMPVWGIWLDSAYYFSTSATSQKARNLAKNTNCVVCNDNAEEAVIVEGVGEKLKEDAIPAKAFGDYKAKYGWELEPKRGPVFRVTPKTVFAMPEKQFPKGVTKWTFE